MILSEKHKVVNLETNKHWIHDPSLQDKNGKTVAMIIACNQTTIPDIWRHDPGV